MIFIVLFWVYDVDLVFNVALGRKSGWSRLQQVLIFFEQIRAELIYLVFLELLFMLGFYPDFHKKIRNLVGKEVLRIRQQEADAKRSKAN